MKFCIGCEERRGNEFFYRERDSRCKDCTNKYQRDRRRKIKEEKQLEDIVTKMLDKLFKERCSASNENILNMLQEINDKLDNLTINKDRSGKKK